MLYGTKGKINQAIYDFFDGYAGITIYKGKDRRLDFHFTQIAPITNGVLFSFGLDEYSPSRPLHAIEGEIIIDDKAKTIKIIHNGKINAEIRDATREEFRILLDYESDLEMMKKHLKQFKDQVTDDMDLLVQ